MNMKENTAGITLRVIEDYQSNSVTSVSDGNEKRMLVSTRIVFYVFTDWIGTGTLIFSGTVIIEFIGGRKLMTLQGASDLVTQQEGDGEGTFELEVNLSSVENPTVEGSGNHNYRTFMSSTMLLAFGIAIYEGWN